MEYEDADDSYNGYLDIPRMAEQLGIPRVQLLRWLADGTIGPDHYTGSVIVPNRIRFPEDCAEEIMTQFRMNRP